jgi:hypothetical protein
MDRRVSEGILRNAHGDAQERFANPMSLALDLPTTATRLGVDSFTDSISSGKALRGHLHVVFCCHRSELLRIFCNLNWNPSCIPREGQYFNRYALPNSAVG